jgi:hypothetical protein
MSRHFVSVMIDTPDERPLTDKQAQIFVLNAVSTVRDNLAKGLEAKFVSGPYARAVAGSVMYVSKQSFPKEHVDEWDGERLTKEGGPLQDKLVEAIMDKMDQQSGAQACRDFANDLLHLFMTSDLCAPGARQFYESLNDA